MKKRLIALGLDSINPDWLLSALQRYSLPNLTRLYESGIFCRLENNVNYVGGVAPYPSTEGAWVSFQTGVRPNTSGYWSPITYDPKRYYVANSQMLGGHRYESISPFYLLGEQYRVATFDLHISKILPEINGIQVNGWGGHYPYTEVGSQPRELMSQIRKKYGKNPILYKDIGTFWDEEQILWLENNEIDSIQTRAQICCDFLKQESWDLFFAGVGETHGSLHNFWFASDELHPVHGAWKKDDPLKKVFQSLDSAIGRIWQQALEFSGGDEVYFACFSVHGMIPNANDLPNFVFLPELLYRFSFDGKVALNSLDLEDPLPEPNLVGHHSRFWPLEMWRYRNRTLLQRVGDWLLNRELRSPFKPFGNDAERWIPAAWYCPIWPKMRSFALPSFDDGHIRINLKGREKSGIVEPSEYDSECQAITELLKNLTNARTGRPMVRDVVRTRRSATDSSENLPDADLVVVWELESTDVVDSPEFGRIGPFPYYRTGGHHNASFLMLSGPGIPKGKHGPNGETIDLPPTFLELIGAPIPDYMEGRSLLTHTSMEVAQ